MNRKQQPAERRAHLAALAAAQRAALAQAIAPWRSPLALADQGLMALRFIKTHPAVLIGGGVLLASQRAGRVGTWLRYGWVAWQIVHEVRSREHRTT